MSVLILLLRSSLTKDDQPASVELKKVCVQSWEATLLFLGTKLSKVVVDASTFCILVVLFT